MKTLWLYFNILVLSLNFLQRLDGTLQLAHTVGLNAIQIGDAIDLDVKTDLVTSLPPDHPDWQFKYQLE